MRNIALVVSFAAALAGSAVAIHGIVAGSYRPNMVSRFVWTSCTVIGAVTAFADGVLVLGSRLVRWRSGR